MIVTTTDAIPGATIVETLGLVRGSTVRARHIGGTSWPGFATSSAERWTSTPNSWRRPARVASTHDRKRRGHGRKRHRRHEVHYCGSRPGRGGNRRIRHRRQDNLAPLRLHSSLPFGGEPYLSSSLPRSTGERYRERVCPRRLVPFTHSPLPSPPPVLLPSVSTKCPLAAGRTP